jgi:nitrogen fixation NifU-like protein
MDLRQLYQDVIIDHNRSPRNFRRPEMVDREAEGFNPLCGDKLHVYLSIVDGKIADVSFEGSGCAISVASASMMTEALMGMDENEAEALFSEVHQMLTDADFSASPDELGKLVALANVREYPTRVKCASLCWHTLMAALKNKDVEAASVSTE